MARWWKADMTTPPARAAETWPEMQLLAQSSLNEALGVAQTGKGWLTPAYHANRIFIGWAEWMHGWSLEEFVINLS